MRCEGYRLVGRGVHPKAWSKYYNYSILAGVILYRDTWKENGNNYRV